MNRRTTSILGGVLIAASPALAADLPHRKPGLWGVKALHGATIQYCIDSVVDKVTIWIAGQLNPDECHKDRHAAVRRCRHVLISSAR